MIKTNLNTQSGRSMIEMLGVLAIVGVLSVGGIAGYSKAMEKFKINKTADQISQIVTNIRTLYAQQTTYDGLNTANAIKMGVTPDELGTGTTLTHAFGDSIDIVSNDGINSDKYFSIYLHNLPVEACINLVTMDWGNSSSSGLVAIAIGSWADYGSATPNNCSNNYNYTSGTPLLHCSKDGALPISIAAGACRLGYSNMQVGLKFY